VGGRWRYIQLGSDDYHGFMWLFPQVWTNPQPSGTGALVNHELNYHPYLAGAPVGITTLGDAVKLSLRTASSTA
jgi:hypothetical protein